jgi:tetratricopeptide (TPR) repeat protein
MADAPAAPTHRTPVAEPASASTPPKAPSVTPPPEPDAARAAEHAERAGDVELAVEQLTRAARHASDLGGFDEALALVERGYEVLDGVPRFPTPTRLRVGLDLQLARIHWMAAGDGEEFSLPSALHALDRCLQRLGRDDPAPLVAEVHRTIAGIRYDMGDPESLELALKALTAAQTVLTEAGQPLEAARLLNDEAAVWLRIGDPVRANHLLERSREVFERMVPDRAEAREELAQTDHLLAKLLLKTPPRPDKESEALSRGSEYATSARDTFAELGLRADAARVEETLGRLAHRSGKLEEGVEHLLSAAHVQRELGDAIGLARSSEALAELLTDAGDPDAALDMLQRSIVVNLQKGSQQGAAFNRRGLAHLVARIPAERRRTLAPILERLDTLLREVTSTS